MSIFSGEWRIPKNEVELKSGAKVRNDKSLFGYPSPIVMFDGQGTARPTFKAALADPCDWYLPNCCKLKPLQWWMWEPCCFDSPMQYCMPQSHQRQISLRICRLLVTCITSCEDIKPLSSQKDGFKLLRLAAAAYVVFTLFAKPSELSPSVDSAESTPHNLVCS